MITTIDDRNKKKKEKKFFFRSCIRRVLTNKTNLEDNYKCGQFL